ncbi:MAG: MerR family transcriptional regulator [Terracidiphilus sp.]
MATQLNRKRAYEPPPIPDRLYFKIGDVAQLCGVEAYVLRFWESQFSQLKPTKSGTGQRLYRRRDVELAMEIKRLVHGEGYTLAGARVVLDQEQRRPGKRKQREALPLLGGRDRKADGVAKAVGHARTELRELIHVLSAAEPQPARPRGQITPIAAASGMLFP